MIFDYHTIIWSPEIEQVPELLPSRRPHIVCLCVCADVENKNLLELTANSTVLFFAIPADLLSSSLLCFGSKLCFSDIVLQCVRGLIILIAVGVFTFK